MECMSIELKQVGTWLNGTFSDFRFIVRGLANAD